MAALALILARAGSKGLPGKNDAPIAGKPCIAWTIEHALRSTGGSRVVVSTDGERLARIARDCGAETLTRPPELASDTATVDDAARHAVRALEAADGRRLDPIVILYANAPVRPADLVDRALETLRSTGADSVQSYCPVGKHHPWWTARVDERTGAVKPWDGAVLNHGVFRRQDLPPAFIPDGGVIALRRAALMLEIEDVPPGPHAFFGKDRRAVRTREGEVIDIDSEIDLMVADATLRRAMEGRGAPAAAGANP